MKRIPGFLVLTLLLACEYNSPDFPEILPTRAVYIDEASGKQVGVETFTYDKSGRIILESLKPEPGEPTSFETAYEYDFYGHPTRIRSGADLSSGYYHVKEMSYKDNLLICEREYTLVPDLGKVGITSRRHFYSFGVMRDSTWQSQYGNNSDEELNRATIVYQYQDGGRLVNEHTRNFTAASTWYIYDNNRNLVSKCLNANGGTNYCEELNEYDSNGKKIKTSYSYGSVKWLKEELFYNGKMLSGKRIYNYPMYGDVNRPVATIVRYEYVD